VRSAAELAQVRGLRVVDVGLLDAKAGTQLAGEANGANEIDALAPTESQRRRTVPADAEIEEALRASRGSVAGAARALGIHRKQLRRWVAKREMVQGGLLDQSAADDEHNNGS
jgi:DNA-binding NtrC family response regulator